MKITHNKVGTNLNVRDTGKTEKSEKAKGAAAATDVGDVKASALEGLGKSSDSSRVNLSERAQDIKRATEMAKGVPDVDEAKVARLQELIDKGEYKVDAKEIASKMVDEHASWE